MKIDREKLEYILHGACFLASGGGGPISLGQMCIDASFSTADAVDVIDINSVEETQWLVPASGMGLPSGSFNSAELNMSVYNALKTMENWCKDNKEDFKEFTYILPIEVGAVNSILAIIAAKLANDNGSTLKVINADPSGRAVPTLPLTLFAGNNFPFYPNFIASGGETPYFASYNLESIEHIQECFTQIFTSSAFKNSGGISLYPTLKKDLSDSLIVQGTMLDSLKIGEIFSSENTSKQNTEKIITYMNKESSEKRTTKEIFYGTLINFNTKVEQGHDIGVLEIQGLGEFKDKMLKAFTANENIYANIIDTNGEKPYIMGPDSICYIPEVYKIDGSIDTSIKIADVTEIYELYQNKNIKTINLYVIGIDAPSNVKNSTGLIANWQTFNQSLGGEDSYTQPWLK